MRIGSQGISWAGKAAALDRYRWLLLRERHGWLGSAVRFAREAIADWWFGMRARCLLAGSVESEPCDFLLLQSAPKVITFQRKKLLIEALRSRGQLLVETALPEVPSILRERLLRPPPQPVPLSYFGYAAHAEWLVERHAPRVLLNDRNGSLYSPFLRLALNASGNLLVHLAHASTVEGSRRLGMNDYDYYFLFGQSSLEALQARELRFGTSTAVLAGSHMIDTAFDLQPADPAHRVLLVLGVGPDKEKEPGYQRTYRLLRDWAAQNSGYRVMIKAHPRSLVPFWQQEALTQDNIEVLPRECGLAEALARASVVVNIMSNAVIEAALARRPLIYVNASDDADIFAQERFLGPCVTSTLGLQEAVADIERDPVGALARSAEFAEFHLAHGCEGLTWNVQALSNLLEGRCPLGVSVSLTSTVEQ